MSYLSSMETVQLVEKSPSDDNILISVRSTPQCESKEHSNLEAMDENAATEDDAPSLQHDDQNILPENSETPNEMAVENGSDNHDLEMLNENVPLNQTNDITEPLNECNAKTVEDVPEAAEADTVTDGTDETPSTTDNENMANVTTMPPTTPVIQTQNDDDKSMDSEEDALHIDTSCADIDDVTMADANSESENQANGEEVANSANLADTNTNLPMNVDIDEVERKSRTLEASQNSSPAISPVQSSPSTSIASTNPAEQPEQTDHKPEIDGECKKKIWKFLKCHKKSVHSIFYHYFQSR